jgi:hypothetical protein
MTAGLLTVECCRRILYFSVLSNHAISVLLHNGGFCNDCITKRILLLQAFYSLENQYYADYDKKYYNFYLFNLLS